MNIKQQEQFDHLHFTINKLSNEEAKRQLNDFSPTIGGQFCRSLVGLTGKEMYDKLMGNIKEWGKAKKASRILEMRAETSYMLLWAGGMRPAGYEMLEICKGLKP